MKKYLVIALMIIPTFCKAQFLLTPEGFVDEGSNENSYVVLEYEGLSQGDLYKKALLFITSSYRSPKDVISEVPSDMITVNGIQDDAIGIGKVLGSYAMVYDINYTITLRFKDGRIRIDSPSFDCSTFTNGKTYRLTLAESNGGLGAEVKKGIFKKNGKINDKGAKERLEIFFNNFAERLNDSLSGNTDANDDW